MLTTDQFDPKQIQCLHDQHMSNVARQLVDLFVIHTPGLIAMMDEALHVYDLRALRRALVRLRGSSTAVGGTQLAELCASGEYLLDTGRLRNFPALFVRIKRAYDDLCHQLPDAKCD